jgi:hypothetical protein
MDAFNFTQSSPSTTWNINHKLNNLNPNVDVRITYRTVFQKVLPYRVVGVDANNITIVFTSPQSGTARIIA